MLPLSRFFDAGPNEYKRPWAFKEKKATVEPQNKKFVEPYLLMTKNSKEKNMSEDNEYSDSDDDVCFGYSLKEAKKDLRKYVGNKVNRRHSAISKFREGPINTSEETYLTPNESMSSERLSQNSEFLERLNKVINEPLSEASSYNTALDETTDLKNKNFLYEDTFLEKYKNQTASILDNNALTLVENTVISNEESLDECNNSDILNNESCSLEDIIVISDESMDGSFTQLQKSSYEIITQEELNISKSPVMSNGGIKCEQLLTEAINDDNFNDGSRISIKRPNSFYDDSTFEIQLENQDDDRTAKSVFGFKTLSISDSDTEQGEYSFNISLQDISEDLANKQESSDDTSFDLITSETPPQQRYERVIVDCKQLSKISEKTEFITCIENSSNMKQQNESRRTSTSSSKVSNSDIERSETELKRATTSAIESINSSFTSEVSQASGISGVLKLSKNSEVNELLQVSRSSETSRDSQSSAISPVQVPELQLEQFDYSGQFDDTLEDMNRFLAQCAEYELTPSKVTPLKSSSNSLDQHKFYTTGKTTKPSVEVKGSKTTEKSGYQYESKIKPPSVSRRNLLTKHTDKLGVETAFKVPTKPAAKLTTPSKLSKPAVKNVISPVGVYIRHTRYSPVIRVPQNTGQSTSSKLVRVDSSPVKENIPCSSNMEIPQVIYKPAKTKITKEEKDIKLPGSIKKLINEEVLTKHDRRIQDDERNQSLGRRLIESNLTIDLGDSNQDISVLTYKQAFDIKKF